MKLGLGRWQMSVAGNNSARSWSYENEGLSSRYPSHIINRDMYANTASNTATRDRQPLRNPLGSRTRKAMISITSHQLPSASATSTRRLHPTPGTPLTPPSPLRLPPRHLKLRRLGSSPVRTATPVPRMPSIHVILLRHRPLARPWSRGRWRIHRLGVAILISSHLTRSRRWWRRWSLLRCSRRRCVAVGRVVKGGGGVVLTGAGWLNISTRPRSVSVWSRLSGLGW